MCNALECGPIAQAGARFDAGASATAAGGMTASTAGMIISSLAAAMHLAARWSNAVRRQRVPLVAALRLGFLAALVWAMPLRLPPLIQPSPADGAAWLAAACISGSVNYESLLLAASAALLPLPLKHHLLHIWTLLFVGFGLPTAAVAVRWWAQRAQRAQQEAAEAGAARPVLAVRAASPPEPGLAGSGNAPASPLGGVKSSSSVQVDSNSTPRSPCSGARGTASDSTASGASSEEWLPLPARLHGPLMQALSWLVLVPAAGAALWSALEAIFTP
ncbi:hypothetical protein ABPG77_009737 [Micractinium sp. CCAP 211/92]